MWFNAPRMTDPFTESVGFSSPSLLQVEKNCRDREYRLPNKPSGPYAPASGTSFSPGSKCVESLVERIRCHYFEAHIRKTPP